MPAIARPIRGGRPDYLIADLQGRALCGHGDVVTLPGWLWGEAMTSSTVDGRKSDLQGPVRKDYFNDAWGLGGVPAVVWTAALTGRQRGRQRSLLPMACARSGRLRLRSR